MPASPGVDTFPGKLSAWFSEQREMAVEQQVGVACRGQIDRKIRNRCRCFLLFSRYVMSYSATPWTAARQASLSLTSSQNLLRFMFIESVTLEISNQILGQRSLKIIRILKAKKD